MWLASKLTSIYSQSGAPKTPHDRVDSLPGRLRFRFTQEVGQFSGFHKFCKDFPCDFVEMKQSEQESGASMAYIAISKVAEPIQNRAYQRPLAHKAKLDLVKSRLTSFQTQQVSGSIAACLVAIHCLAGGQRPLVSLGRRNHRSLDEGLMRGGGLADDVEHFLDELPLDGGTVEDVARAPALGWRCRSRWVHGCAALSISVSDSTTTTSPT